MIDILVTPEVRPSRIGIPKDKDYHLKYARYCVSSGFGHPLHKSFIIDNMVFWNFYKGNQWILNEDLGAFLTDESGFARNRVKACINIIRPTVEQWIGNVLRMDFNFKAVNISPEAKTRKEEMLAQMLFLSRTANIIGGDGGAQMKKQFGLGDSEEETEQLHNASYVDKYTQGINYLMRGVIEKNKFKNVIIREAVRQMALTGISSIKTHAQNGEQVFNNVDSNYFFFDRGAIRSDLRDSQFMGDFTYKLPTDIFERYPVAMDNMIKLDNYAKTHTTNFSSLYGIFGVNTDRVPVYETYWKDCDKEEFGFVVDTDGTEMLVQINCDWNNYKDKDLVIPNTEEYKRFIGKGKKVTRYPEKLRYCIFVPKEVVGGDKDGQDIVLEWGEAPYQEHDSLDPYSIEFPYKVNCWNYYAGQCISPIQDIISPQRMINRASSAKDSMINSARLSGTVIAKSAVDAQQGEGEIKRAIASGQTVILDDRNMGVPNMIGTYGTDMSGSLKPFQDYIIEMVTMAQGITGINNAMQGQATPDQLVGVQQNQIQRGTLIQENFYRSIEDVVLQCYQSVAQFGKQIYADSPRKLKDFVGDDDGGAIMLDPDVKNEVFRVFIERTLPEDQARATALTLGLQLFQMGLLGKDEIAYIAKDGSVDDIGRLIDEWTKKLAYADAKKGQAAQGQAAEAERLRQEQIGLGKESQDKEIDLQWKKNQANNVVKERLPFLKEQAKAPTIEHQHLNALEQKVVDKHLTPENQTQE